jgi:hypothetical protein
MYISISIFKNIRLNIIHIQVINQIQRIILLQITIKKVYFGAADMSDFTIHKDEARKQRYINRHKKLKSV